MNTTRRPLLKLAVGGTALAAVGAAARLPLHPGPDAPPAEADALTLATHGDTDVASLNIRLGEDLLPRVGTARWESRRLPTSTHSMVAFTWGKGQSRPRPQIRSRNAGAWGDWVSVPTLDAAPEPDGMDEADLTGTDLMWIGRADGIQVRVEGRRPDDLTLVLVYPERRASDQFIGQSSTRLRSSALESGTRSAELDTRSPRPSLVTRAQWGANESLRKSRPNYIDTIKQVHVHHTVNSNTYAPEDVPALIRGMYSYHTQTLGWSDIGYNFLVDRFGRSFVGRAGGADQLVLGAHTRGFNGESTGISAIGNYDSAHPSDGMLDAIAAIAAWKLDPFDRDPRGEVRVESEGSDKYGAGRTVQLPVIDGHRDTNDTACPGRNLYAALPDIRLRTARINAAAQEQAILVDEPAMVLGVPSLGSHLRAEPGRYRPSDSTVRYRWLRSDQPIRKAWGQSYRIRPGDVGHQITCRVTLVSEGLDSVTQMPRTVGPVTAEPRLTVTTRARGRVVRVSVDVAAPAGVPRRPRGRVIVKVGNRATATDLKSGRAVARFGAHRRLAPGTYAVRVVYEGRGGFAPASFEGSIRLA